MPVIYRQNDDAWSMDFLGHSPSSRLGGKGCMPSSVAMAVSNLTDRRMTPRDVNDAARKAGGFVAGTGTGILERMAASVKLLAPESMRVREKDPSVKGDVSALTDLIEAVLGGKLGPFKANTPRGLIVNVDHSGDGKPDHFVYLHGRHPGGGWILLDPAPGSMVHLLPTMMATADWGTKARPHPKTYRVWGVAPIGVPL